MRRTATLAAGAHGQGARRLRVTSSPAALRTSRCTSTRAWRYWASGGWTSPRRAVMVGALVGTFVTKDRCHDVPENSLENMEHMEGSEKQQDDLPGPALHGLGLRPAAADAREMYMISVRQWPPVATTHTPPGSRPPHCGGLRAAGSAQDAHARRALERDRQPPAGGDRPRDPADDRQLRNPHRLRSTRLPVPRQPARVVARYAGVVRRLLDLQQPRLRDDLGRDGALPVLLAVGLLER